jgi:hypothetical protein
LHKNANMRTSLDIPDTLFRHLKTRAAMEGSTLRDLVLSLVARGMEAPAASPIAQAAAVDLPRVRLGAPMALQGSALSNAALSALLDE